MTQEEKIQALRDLGRNVQIIDDKPTVDGSLLLCNTDITSLPDNLVVSGSLNLFGSDIKSLPDNLVVGGYIDLTVTRITTLPNNLVVGSHLNLGGIEITSLPDDIVVGGSLYLNDTNITSLPDNLVINGNLCLQGSKIKSLPDNLTVRGWLDISDTEITSLPNNLVVGGNIYSENNKVTSLPDNLVVGGCIYKKGSETIDINHDINVDFVEKIWGNKPYCCVDAIFTEVVNRRGKVWTVRNIGEAKTFYLVNDGNGNYAHGNTIKQAKKDLIYKITNRDKSDYEKLTLESVLTHDEAIQCYRVITGACSFGAKKFVENILPTDERKDQYTIAEIVRLTEGQYGNETFAEFFKNNK